MSELRKGVKIACWPLTTRPGFPGVPPSLDGDFVTDAYSRVSFAWFQADGRWRPVGSTRAPIMYWIDPVAGSDANDGAAGTPLATVQEAIDRLPPEIRHTVQIQFLDGGNPITIDEPLRFIGFSLSAPIVIVGNSRPAVPATGPNAVAPNPLHTGDLWSITVPGAGWTPGDLIGMWVQFTAGPRAGLRSYIIDNTDTTIFFARRPLFDGPYGPADGFAIRENLETFEFAGMTGEPTIFVQDVRGNGNEAISLQFTGVNIYGDWSGTTSLDIEGDAVIGLVNSVLADYVYSATAGEAAIYSMGSFHWTTRSGGNAQFEPNIVPQTHYSLFLQTSGVRGQVYAERAYWFSSNAVADPGTPLPDVLRFHGHDVELFNVGINAGNSYNNCIGVGRAAHGHLTLNQVELRSALYSGVGPEDLEYGSVGCRLVVDYMAFLPSDFADNRFYGIDATGCRLEIWGQPYSSVGNGVAGARVRKGTQVMTYDLAGICGPIPILTEIDFDDRAPPWFLRWATDATGLETLCHQQYHGPPP